MDYIKLAIFLFIASGNVTTLGSPTTAIDDFDKFNDSEVTSWYYNVFSHEFRLTKFLNLLILWVVKLLETSFHSARDSCTNGLVESNSYILNTFKILPFIYGHVTCHVIKNFNEGNFRIGFLRLNVSVFLLEDEHIFTFYVWNKCTRK